MKGFMPIGEIFKNVKEGRFDEDDLVDLASYNPNLFAYTQLRLPFKRFSPNQERILDTFYDPAKHYRELLLACGRKSFKTGLSATILLFEVYKMLTLMDNPHELFGLLPKEKIYFMLIGTAKDQAQGVSYEYIKSLAKSSPYLHQFITNETNVELSFEKHLVVRVQASSAKSGRGFTSAIHVYDEIAHFIDNRGNLSGSEIYYALQPNLKPLAPYSRTMLVSSPAGRTGIFWENFKTGVPEHVIHETPEAGEETWRATFQFATWDMNPKLPFNCLTCQKEAEKQCHACPSAELYYDWKKSKEKFAMEWGAEFCDVVSPALSSENVMNCGTGKMIDMVAIDKETARVIGLDPALSGNSYALVMGHAQGNLIVVDLIKYWQGDRDYPVKISIVEDFIETLYKQFYITHMVADQFQSAGTIQRLQERGFSAFIVHSTSKYNQDAYTRLIDRINLGTIVYPPHKTLLNELSFLQRKQNGKSVRYEASVNSSDDIADALALVVHTLDTEGGKRIMVERL